MSTNPTPNFQNLKYQALSTKKERKNFYSNFAPPPKAPPRSCPVPRLYSVFKSDAPRPVSFRDDCNSSFISDSSLYSVNKGTYFEQCFSVERLLGRGSFGEVFKVISKESGLSYACKRTLLKYRGELDRHRRIQEVRKHEELPPHDNCIKFYRAWEEANHLYLLIEECQYSLADILQNNHEFEELQLWYFLVDILQGLHHLHLHKLIHMDVKPDNIFIGKDGLCKLGDFGLVIDFSDGYPSDAVEGDPKYLAPECLQNIYTPAADMFSLGMVMLEVATDLFLPQRGSLWHDLRSGVVPPLCDKGFSSEFESIITGFLTPDHKTRVTSLEALSFKSVKSVIRRKSVVQFVKGKVLALKWYLQSLLLWPVFAISCVSSAVSSRFIEDTKSHSSVVPQASNSLNISCQDVNRKEVTDLANSSPMLDLKTSSSFALMQPIINSTPIHSGRRRIFPHCNLSRSNCDVDSVDGSKLGFNESSLSSLDGLCDLSDDHQSPFKQEQEDPLLSSMNVTCRNLLDLFNSVDSSEDEL